MGAQFWRYLGLKGWGDITFVIADKAGLCKDGIHLTPGRAGGRGLSGLLILRRVGVGRCGLQGLGDASLHLVEEGQHPVVQDMDGGDR